MRCIKVQGPHLLLFSDFLISKAFFFKTGYCYQSLLLLCRLFLFVFSFFFFYCWWCLWGREVLNFNSLIYHYFPLWLVFCLPCLTNLFLRSQTYSSILFFLKFVSFTFTFRSKSHWKWPCCGGRSQALLLLLFLVHSDKLDFNSEIT